MGLYTMSRRDGDRNRHSAQGLAERLLEAWRALRERGGGAARRPAREMRVLETLSVGGRNQLHLVNCGGQRYLVGTGPESVGTIVQVRPETAAMGLARSPVERM